ncbi:hypothetical protein A0H81_04292 [Grifola frondosa]|uniref:Charged multivesicular body protein 7 n=1 Tax=Grifola frondosa TaxID=5627 RepID=A0A1C7MF32_GRIFR|nr:hypothetical protein A0H81_04292 [Grifola frondosa]
MSPISTARLASLETYATSSTSRLKSLYSDFSLQKQSNPTSYASNVEWWRKTFESVVLKGWTSQSHAQPAYPDRLVLHANGPLLADEFRLEGVGKPLSLATVVAELCSSKAYFSVTEFLNSARSPLWWALQQLNVVSSEDAVLGHGGDRERWKRVRGDYVVLSLLESAAEKVLERQRNKSGRSLADSLYDMEDFRREFAGHALNDAVLSDLDLKILIKFLERDKRVIIVQREVIKFVDADSSQPAEITVVDAGILELKCAVEKLHAQVDTLQQKIDQRLLQASMALKQKRKELALSHLRARKQLEDVLKKRLGSLDLLQSTLLRVEASAGDVEIMKSYESSTATLRAILAHPSLQRDKIDETMDAMASANADAREVDDAIRMGADMAQMETGIDESELEAELAALVKESESETTAQAQAGEDEQELAALQAFHERLGDLRSPLNNPVVSAEKPQPGSVKQSVKT